MHHAGIIEAFISHSNGVPPVLFGIRLEFILFALTLVGVALFHRHTMYVALTGLLIVVIAKYLFVPDFSIIEHIIGTSTDHGEWRTLLNLFGLLLGFAILSKHFEISGVPDKLPAWLPNDWTGGLVLLVIIMILSSFLDNIASAMIGGTIALVIYKGRVHMGYIAAIIAASNAGGAGSVIGDTTTTLMWIDGVHPVDVLHAFIASFAAFAVFGVVGSIQQQRYQKIQKDPTEGIRVDWGRLIIVALILICTIVANYFFRMPALGVWFAILLGIFIRKTPWKEIRIALPGSIFLISLVTIASLMPVEELPEASWRTSFSLGFISSVFDNIPLTKLCLEQGGYDWGLLAYAVGFGGSMIWFGSSAGVALTNKFQEARSVFKYVRYGWHVIPAYVSGFFILLAILGWNPMEKRGIQRTNNVEVIISVPVEQKSGTNP